MTLHPRDNSRLPGIQERLPSGRLAPLVPDYDRVIVILAFSVETLPDLWRYVTALGRRLHLEMPGRYLVWELDTAAGRFVLSFVAGELVDVMHHPVRPVGARGGKRALATLFRQLGGSSCVSLVEGPPLRVSAFDSAEQLLIEMATQEDEAVAPAVLEGRTYDVSAELAAVLDVPEPQYPTKLRVLSSVSPLTDVLQLVSGLASPFCVSVSPDAHVCDGSGRPVFRFVLRDGVVLAVWSVKDGWAAGQSVFSSLVSGRRTVCLSVSAWTEGAAWGELGPLGRLDALLMREVLSGRFMPDSGPAGSALTLFDLQDWAGVGAGARSAGPVPGAAVTVDVSDRSAGGRAGWLGRVLAFVTRGRARTE